MQSISSSSKPWSFFAFSIVSSMSSYWSSDKEIQLWRLLPPSLNLAKQQANCVLSLASLRELQSSTPVVSERKTQPFYSSSSSQWDREKNKATNRMYKGFIFKLK